MGDLIRRPTLRERFAAVRSAWTEPLAIADPRRGYGVAGRPYIRFNPDDLVGKKGLSILDEMTRDYQVKACLWLKRCAILGPGWKLDPGDDSEAAHQVAEDLTNDLNAMDKPLVHHMSEILNALTFGYSILEKIYDTNLRLLDLQSRAPFYIDFVQDDWGNIAGIRQSAGPNFGKTLPKDKFILWQYDADFENPYGTSDLRAIYREWFQKDVWLQSWMVWGQKLADSPVWVKHPQQTPPEVIDQVIGEVDQLQSRATIAVPEGWEINLLESNKVVRDVFVGTLDRLDTAIARGMLVPDLLGFSGGEAKGGSLARSGTAFNAFFFILEELRTELTAVIQKQLIDQMHEFYGASTPAPRFAFLPIAEDDRQKIAELWVKAVTGKVVLSDVRDENHMRELLGFPEVEETQDQSRDAMLQKQAEQEQVAADQAAAAHDANIGLLNAKAAGTATPDQAPQKPGDKPPPNGGGKPAPAAKKEMAELQVPSKFSRTLNFREERANFSELKDSLEQDSTDLSHELATASAGIAADLRKKCERLLNAGLKASDVKKLRVSPGAGAEFRRQLADGLSSSYEDAQKSAKKELKAAKATMSERIDMARGGLSNTKAQAFFKAKSFDITGKYTTDLLARAKQVLYNSLKQDKTTGQTLYELDQELNEFIPEFDAAGRAVNVPARIETIARTNLAEAVNEGRYALFTDPDLEGFVEGLQYTAVMDARTRETHAAWDEVTLPIDHPAWFGPPDNRPPNGYNCRCMLLPVTAGETADWTPEDEIPSEPAADDGFK